MGRELKLQNEILNHENNDIDKALSKEMTEKIDHDNSNRKQIINHEGEEIKDKKVQFFTFRSIDNKNNPPSNFKISSSAKIIADNKMIKDNNLLPKNIFKNYNYYKNNNRNRLKTSKNFPEIKSHDVFFNTEKTYSNKASSKKLISNTYINLNLLSVQIKGTATSSSKKRRLMSSSPATNSNSTQISINKNSFNMSLNKYHHLFDSQINLCEIKENNVNKKGKMNQIKHVNNYSHDYYRGISSPKSVTEYLRPFSANNEKNNAKSNSIFSLDKNLKREITKVNNIKNEKAKINGKIPSNVNRNIIQRKFLEYKYKNTNINRLMTSYVTEYYSKVDSPARKKELNYVNFLDNKYTNFQTQNALFENKDLCSGALTKIAKIEKTFNNQNNSNVKSNNSNLLTHKDNKSSTISSNNKTAKMTNFTLRKNNSNQTKDKLKGASNKLLNEKIKKDLSKIAHINNNSITKGNKAPNKFINADCSNKKVIIVSNIQSPSLTRKTSSKNLIMISPYKEKSYDFNNFLKKKNQINFLNPNNNINPKYAFTSRNFNSEIINQVKNKQFSSYTRPNHIIDSEEEEKLKEKKNGLKYNNFDLLNSLKSALESKFSVRNITHNKESSRSSSDLLVPIELHNSVKNSDESLNKYNTNPNNTNFDQNALKHFNYSNEDNNLSREKIHVKQKPDLDNLSNRQNSFLDYRLTYLSDNCQHIEYSSHNRCFSADKNENVTREFIRNKYKDVLNYYLSEPNIPVYSFYV